MEWKHPPNGIFRTAKNLSLDIMESKNLYITFLICVENTIIHPMDKTPKLDVLFPHPYPHIP